jgi:hypothetical protein
MKKFVRGRKYDIPTANLEAIPFWCGMSYCGIEGYNLVGPKGKYRVI